MKTRIVILGAGPAGLGAAWRLSQRGIGGYTLFEMGEHAGGLASSYTDACGFTWDFGGHVVHSHFTEFDRMFDDVMEGAYTTIRRDSRVFLYNRYIPFPLQNNIRHLPPRIMASCLAGLRAAAVSGQSDPGSFAGWIRRTYGDGLARIFMLPFNKKIWSYPLSRMGYGWVADRVAPVDLAAIEKSIETQKDDSTWGPNSVFMYPLRGGNGDLWRRVAGRVSANIRYGMRAVRIDAAAHTVGFADGTRIGYDRLFTTIPLDVFSGIVTGIHIPSARGLVRTSVTAVGIGIRGVVPVSLRSASWIYYPDTSIPFFRVTVLSNYSPHNAPPGTWSLLFEITSPSEKRLPGKRSIADCIRSARAIGLIPGNPDIVSRWMMQSTYGYPVPTQKRDSIVDPLVAALASFGIHTGGRFGLWKYEISNQDHAFMQGYSWADSISE